MEDGDRSKIGEKKRLIIKGFCIMDGTLCRGGRTVWTHCGGHFHDVVRKSLLPLRINFYQFTPKRNNVTKGCRATRLRLQTHELKRSQSSLLGRKKRLLCLSRQGWQRRRRQGRRRKGQRVCSAERKISLCMRRKLGMLFINPFDTKRNILTLLPPTDTPFFNFFFLCHPR